jgi:hypothetical protein
MKNEYIGEALLAELQALEVQLMHSGRAGLLSLITACIEDGWDTEEAILAKVQQVGGPYYDFEVPKLLAIHSAPCARRQLWEEDNEGRYHTIMFDPRNFAFWKPGYKAPTDTDLAR